LKSSIEKIAPNVTLTVLENKGIRVTLLNDNIVDIERLGKDGKLKHLNIKERKNNGNERNS